MKAVEKEIKKVVTYFETFDGKDFKKRGDAIWQEYEELVKLEELQVFEYNGCKTDWFHCEVVYIKTQRALEAFIAINDYEGFYDVGLDECSELGWYFWNDRECMWLSPQKKLNLYKKEINEILKTCGGVGIE